MRSFTIKLSDVRRCPKGSLAVEHYREDGSCLCDVASERLERARALREQARRAYEQARDLEKGL